MRLSTQQFFQTSLLNIQRSNVALGRTQEQLSTGIRVLEPSDDPVASAKIAQLQERISLVGQYQSNIDIATSMNELSESVLSGVNDNLQRIRDLALQSNSSALSNDNRASIAEEIKILLKALQGQLNTNNGLGGYLYSGFQTTQLPFAERSSGGFDYRGDEGQNFLQISTSSQVEITDSGKELFVDLPATNPTVVTYPSPANSQKPRGEISIGNVIDPEAFAAQPLQDYVIEFNDPDLNQGRQTFSVYNAKNGQPVYGSSPAGQLVNVVFDAGRTVEFNGISVTLSGSPQTGDRFLVESTSSSNMLNMINRFADFLTQLSLDSVLVPATTNLIGRASPPNLNLNSAGNYVAEQTITVTGPGGSISTYSVAAGDSTASIAAGLGALAGVTATASPTQATIDFRNTDWAENEIMSFRLNGALLSVPVGATDAATYANIDAAIAAALPGLPTLSSINNGDGTWSLTESAGNDISIEDFQVTDFPQVTLDVIGGFNIGDNISFTLNTSTGASIPVSYVVAATGSGVIDEFSAALQGAITGAGFAADFNITQPGGPGTPISVQYVGDTNGDASFDFVNFSDGVAENAQLQAVTDTGNQVVNQASGSLVTAIAPSSSGSTYSIEAREGRSTMQLGGNGPAMTLVDNGNDSSAVAAELTITLAGGYEISSDVASLYGGLIREEIDPQTALANRFQSTMTAFLTDLDNVMEGVTSARSRISARLNTLSNIQISNEGVLLELRTFLSDVRDLDYAEAASRLNLQTFIVQAAQQSFVRISQLNLFNLL